MHTNRRIADGDNDCSNFHSNERFRHRNRPDQRRRCNECDFQDLPVKEWKENIKEVKTHTIHYGYICDGEETVDEVLVMVMRGPKTYTGEDTVEIDCHGGVFAMKKVLETVLKTERR